MRLAMFLAGVSLWVGLAMLLAELRWFSRVAMVERLGPYVQGGDGFRTRRGILSMDSFREAIGPAARAIGARSSRLFGISEDLDRRLRRVHSDLDVTQFRVRQVGWSLAGFGVGGLLSVAIRAPGPFVVIFTIGGMVLPFLVLEQQVTAASDRWKQRAQRELPVTAEQIAMLLATGYSLVAALDRICERGDGAIARDLRRALIRIGHGVDEEQALAEWAELSDVPAVGRLVSVLALNRDASDLGHLIAAESRSIRREAQRELIEVIERRGQQVWIPVTVATLVPGAIFIGIPFTAALDDFLG